MSEPSSTHLTHLVVLTIVRDRLADRLLLAVEDGCFDASQADALLKLCRQAQRAIDEAEIAQSNDPLADVRNRIVAASRLASGKNR